MTYTKTKRWIESPAGQWSNAEGYTLQKTPDGKAWRLSDPAGRFVVDQLELFPHAAPLTDWVDQLLRARRRKG